MESKTRVYSYCKKPTLDCQVREFWREALTSWVDALLLVELFRRSRLNVMANRILPAKGLKQGQIGGKFCVAECYPPF